MDAPPACLDGVSLAPISVFERPLPSSWLPNCKILRLEASVNYGDGQCGTRTDIDNYDDASQDRASRDVYRKSYGDSVSPTVPLLLLLKPWTPWLQLFFALC